MVDNDKYFFILCSPNVIAGNLHPKNIKQNDASKRIINKMELLTQCPVCHAGLFQEYLTCTDYTVSHQEFKLVICMSCGLAFTNPRPEEKDIGAYYQSEDYISHSDTTKGLIHKMYQAVRRYTLKKKYQLIQQRVHPNHILDIGCGTGAFLSVCKQNSVNVTGIEPNAGAREAAVRHYGLNVYEPAHIRNFPDGSFDVITMWHVLEHIYDVTGQVRHLKRLLKPGGFLFIALPNRESYDAEHYGRFWAAYDVPRHLFHFTRNNVSDLFGRYGMIVTERIPMKFDAYYVSLLSEKYRTGRIRYGRAFLNGMQSNRKAKKSDRNYSSLIYIIGVA